MFKLIILGLTITTSSLSLAADTIEYRWGEAETQTPQEFYGRGDLPQGELVSSWSANTPAPKPPQD